MFSICIPIDYIDASLGSIYSLWNVLLNIDKKKITWALAFNQTWKKRKYNNIKYLFSINFVDAS